MSSPALPHNQPVGDLFTDFDLLSIPAAAAATTPPEPKDDTPWHPAKKFRRRSSSVPPAFHSNLAREPRPQPTMNSNSNTGRLVFAQVQVADTRPPAQNTAPSAAPVEPIQIERLRRKPPPPVDPAKKRAEMDYKLRHVNFDDVTVAELKELLRHCGKHTTGRKSDLIQRLKTERERILTTEELHQTMADMSLQQQQQQQQQQSQAGVTTSKNGVDPLNNASMQ